MWWRGRITGRICVGYSSNCALVVVISSLNGILNMVMLTSLHTQRLTQIDFCQWVIVWQIMQYWSHQSCFVIVCWTNLFVWLFTFSDIFKWGLVFCARPYSATICWSLASCSTSNSFNFLWRFSFLCFYIVLREAFPRALRSSSLFPFDLGCFYFFGCLLWDFFIVLVFNILDILHFGFGVLLYMSLQRASVKDLQVTYGAAENFFVMFW